MQLTIFSNNTHPTTGTTYDPATGIMKIELGTAHGLAVGEEVTLDNGSIAIPNVQKIICYGPKKVPRITDLHTEKNVKL